MLAKLSMFRVLVAMNLDPRMQGDDGCYVGQEGVQVHSTLHFNWELGREWPVPVYRYFNVFTINYR
jgi:hypothetical protein